MSDRNLLRQQHADQSAIVKAKWALVEGFDVKSENVDTEAGNKLVADYDVEKTKLDNIEEDLSACEKEHDALLAAVDSRRTPQAQIEPGRPQISVTQPEEDRPFSSFGEQLQAVYRAGLSGGIVDVRLRNLQAAATGMGVDENSAGGYAVQTDYAADIFRRAYEGGSILSRVRRIPLSANSNSIKIPAIDESSRVAGSRFGGVRAYWVQEGTAPTASEMKLRQINLSVQKLSAIAYMTDELLADASALGSILGQSFSEEITFAVEDSILNGNGAGQPSGIMNSSALVSVSRAGGGNDVDTADIVAMWARCWGRSRANAVWLINQDVEPDLYAITLSNQPMFIPAGGIGDAPQARLMGRPVVENEHSITKGTSGDIMLVDLSQYVLADKGTPTQASSMHVKFVEDEMTFRITYRVDGAPLWNAALTPAQGSNTQSPYVVLA